jgi:DNA-binding XRE family transcriptional regulator
VALKRYRFAQRRQDVGFTQEAFAEALGVERSTVVRWEAGTSDPQPWQRPRLARLLRLSVDELRELLAAGTPPREAKFQRREHALRNPARIDLTTVNDLRGDLLDLADRYDRMPSSTLLAEAGQHLGQVTFLAGEAPTGRLQRGLRSLQADTTVLMGQLVWDASQRRDHDTARSYYAQSAEVARHLRDRTAEAHALLRTCYVELYGARDARAGLVLAQRAAQTAESASPALAGLAHLHIGEAYAMLGHDAECRRALELAHEYIGRSDGTDAAGELCTPTQFGRIAGSCYLALGQHRKAQAVLEPTATELQDRRKSRSIVLGNLSLALIRQRELEGALETLNEAIDELELTRGGGGMNLIFGAARELRPWRNQLAVHEVQDRMLALMTTA